MVVDYDPYPDMSSGVTLVQDPYAPWPTISSSGGEIDLRAELSSFLRGSSSGVAKGQVGVLRRARRDVNSKILPCPCISVTTAEPDKDSFCPFCHGEGKLWDEEFILYYKVLSDTSIDVRRPGIQGVPVSYFYFEYNVVPTKDDKIVELKRDLDGTLVSPMERTLIHTPTIVEPLRSDSGRVEYWRVVTEGETVKAAWQR